ncbi:SGNH hydrolase [Actinopolyspora erythraea]|uniref:SGNH hydrolase n=1 Tax=Actinopolyspora erythraea TaxID=414996 RepID=A0A099D2K5_9ACTN|nr:SGNH/GDSL hydrolase family protein [Actinopolyspora erythraea]ASU77324.1 SGNH hydrolase [Actinopolyspora erythraea]KGI80186.1 SGNH hydrolase [Actinopolyspora erythraea]
MSQESSLPGEYAPENDSREERAGWRTFVALGDSFTEGLNDPAPDGATFRGWADRLAARLAAERPGLRYANIAVRGKLLDQILREQLPRAVEMRPDLAALSAGGNDILRPFGDPDELAGKFEKAVVELRSTGADVLIGTGFDTRRTPVMRLVRGKVGTYNSHLWAIAQRHGCYVVDLWSMRVLQDERAWSEDRLHLSEAGHHRVSLRAAEALGLPVSEDWRRPWPARRERPWSVRRGEDLRWIGEHLGPWFGRRLRGTSSGDGREPKRPSPRPLEKASPREDA